MKNKLKCDFLLIKFESPFKFFKKLEMDQKTEMSDNTYMDLESIAQDRATDIGGCIKYNDSDLKELDEINNKLKVEICQNVKFINSLK